MNSPNLPTIIHALVGLAIIATLATLGALGVIAGKDALAAITGVGGLLLGSGATTLGANITNPTSPAPAPRAPGQS